MKIYVTGATGYVGSRLIPRLKLGNHEITCLLRTPEKYIDNDLFDNCTLIKGDITNQDSIRDTINQSDVLIHLAVATPLTNLNGEESIYKHTNVQGTKNLLEECKTAKPKRIICFSSTAAIGRPMVDIIDENSPLNPVNDYGRSKKEADELISSFVKNDHLPIITICFPHIYGPGEVHDLLKIIKMIKKGILPQVGFGSNFLPMVYITDAIEAIMLSLNNGNIGEKYIIADEDPHDLRTIRKQVLSILGINRKIYPILPKDLGIFGAYLIEKLSGVIGITPPVKVENIKSIIAGRRLSIDKAKKELGFVPKVSFKAGIGLTISWYQENNLI